MNNSKPLPPISELVRLFDYDSVTGVLRWRQRPRNDFPDSITWKSWNTRRAGTPAGTKNRGGMLVVKLNGRSMLAHRIGYAIETGTDPVDWLIVHGNGVGTDNHIGNLRLASRADVNHEARVRARK